VIKEASIVTVHGVIGKGHRTWQYENGLTLPTLLSQRVRRTSHVIDFQYDPEIFGPSDSKVAINAAALQLLERIWQTRKASFSLQVV
jgi:hypothetical protein